MLVVLVDLLSSIERVIKIVLGSQTFYQKFPCSVCEKLFPLSSYLREHFNGKEGDPKNDNLRLKFVIQGKAPGWGGGRGEKEEKMV